MSRFDPDDDADRYDYHPGERVFSRRFADGLQQHARPDCPECQGEGFIPICWNGDPSRCEDIVCVCVDEFWVREHQH